MTKAAEPTPTFPIPPRLLRIEQAAEYLGVTISFFETLYRDGSVKAVDLHTATGERQKRMLFCRFDLDRYVEQMKAAPQA